MILFILGLIALVGAIISAIVWRAMDDPKPDKYSPSGRTYDYKRQMKYITFSLIVVGFLAIIFSTLTVVQAKTIGVKVTFGHVSENTLTPGLHFKSPITKVIKIDGTIQTDEYRDRGKKIPCSGAISVRIGDGSRSCLTLTNRWSVNGERANALYQDFRSNDPTKQFRDAVVSTQLKAAAQKVLANYNPIAQLEAVGGAETARDINFAPDYDALSKALTEEMQSRVGDLANIRSVTVSYLSLSESTQKKLDGFIAAVGETRIATQRQETAKAEALANKQLADSISHDPNVLVSKCLDLLSSGYQAPAGFSCWPGGGGSVVIPGTSSGK